MATTAADVPDDFKKWWETFNNGVAVDQGQDDDEDGTDSDSGFEQGQQQEEENAGEETASEAHAPAGREGAAGDCDEEGVSEDSRFPREGELQGRNIEGDAKLNTPRASEDEAEHVSEDSYVQIGGGLQGMKRTATAERYEPQATGNEIQNEEGQDKYVSVDNYVQRLELELHFKTEENKSLKKQNEELRAENEYYRKMLYELWLLRNGFAAEHEDVCAALDLFSL
ncbi:unnamed protein product [Triticum turgidum subsp. durum]|uniref:Uncharacterized protein n=1 Tax=Triticum turgidum subsp. durum TaxID=4567 RepID=A0A9R0VFT5_TRITD|nr:unnamed protein product [Triticum turgidum subsp. durum]